MPNAQTGTSLAGITREKATTERELATAEDRVFTEPEHEAILGAAISKETATLTEKVSTIESEKAQLLTEKAELETKVDTLTLERDGAIAELAAYKAEQARAAEIAARTDERVAAVKAVATGAKDEFFSAERATKWASMEQAAFDDYLAEIKAVAPAAAVSETQTTEKATALSGAPIGDPAPTAGGRGFFDLVKGA